MLSKNGSFLLLPEAVESLKTKLIPLTTLITPNLPEAYVLTENTENLEQLREKLLTLGSSAVLLKGGHVASDQSNDFFIDQQGQKIWFNSPRISSKNTHGTGCTLSAAICSCLALGLSLSEACRVAKIYLFKAIQAAKEHSVGKGNGSVDHFYHLFPTIEKILD